MKRITLLALVVLALAAVPAVAFADGAPPATPPATPPAAGSTVPGGQAGQAGPGDQNGQQQHHGMPLRLQVLRLQIRLARLRYRIACHDQSSDRCTQFTHKAIDRLTTLDQNVQKKIADLQCTADGTDKKCTVLSKLDDRLQQVIGQLQS